MTADELSATLDVIAQKATALRSAGVLSVSASGVTFELTRPDPPIVVVDAGEKQPPMDPLLDPDTYGGEMPRRRGYQDVTEQADGER